MRRDCAEAPSGDVASMRKRPEAAAGIAEMAREGKPARRNSSIATSRHPVFRRYRMHTSFHQRWTDRSSRESSQLVEVQHKFVIPAKAGTQAATRASEWPPGSLRDELGPGFRRD